MDLLLADLTSIDREVARAAAALARWHAQLELDPGSAANVDPLEHFRALAGQKAYETLRARTVSATEDPLRQGLVRWVYALAQARIALPLEAALGMAVAETRAPVVLEVPRLTSWREAWRQVVAAPDSASASTWLSAASACGPAIAAVIRERAARRSEVARRLGLEHPAQLATSTPHAQLVTAAEDLLRATDDLWGHVLKTARAKAGRAGMAPSPVDAIAAALAREASEGWPAHLTSRWLHELFGELTRGLRLDVRVPPALGAASFARAMDRFGRAARAAAAGGLPFALGHDPSPVEAHLFGLFFGALAATVPFHRHALGLSARRAEAQARSLAFSALFEARTVAVRVLLCDEASSPTDDRFEQLSISLFGAPLHRSLRGAWPLPGEEVERFEALLRAKAELAALVENFDEDWFRNPRAMASLRARASTAARGPGRSAMDIGVGARNLARAFEGALG